ncbi:hypothetical protein JK354_02215 [Haloferax volcanii]|uniref:Uncharacterized protein n=1 Tax=Haloferax volcanii TaxID=2246 RepID=A0A8T5C9W4_HALVO|nr:hypothetical protein [Haloferax volcanii]MBS8122994.1 hypothetical protein [Haloferax volcanii]MBS8126862.1 hypothetical protein [Haloferax volcanii]MBS8130728.1 hypothetical protein [Haloferax volcanii]
MASPSTPTNDADDGSQRRTARTTPWTGRRSPGRQRTRSPRERRSKSTSSKHSASSSRSAADASTRRRHRVAVRRDHVGEGGRAAEAVVEHVEAPDFERRHVEDAREVRHRGVRVAVVAGRGVAVVFGQREVDVETAVERPVVFEVDFESVGLVAGRETRGAETRGTGSVGEAQRPRLKRVLGARFVSLKRANVPTPAAALPAPIVRSPPRARRRVSLNTLSAIEFSVRPTVHPLPSVIFWVG